jgi:hypothetical protein
MQLEDVAAKDDQKTATGKCERGSPISWQMGGNEQYQSNWKLEYREGSNPSLELRYRTPH